MANSLNTGERWNYPLYESILRTMYEAKRCIGLHDEGYMKYSRCSREAMYTQTIHCVKAWQRVLMERF